VPARSSYPGTVAPGDPITSANQARLPGGEIGYATATANQGGITTVTDLSNLSITVTTGANRRIRVMARVEVRSDTANDVGTVILANDTNTQLSRANVPMAIANNDFNAVVVYESNIGSASTLTYKLRLQRTSGTGTLQMSASSSTPAIISVQDLGPSF
jgi:hypothetical protein